MSEQSVKLSYFIEITLSEDKLNAYLTFNNNAEKSSFNLAQLEELLEEHGITYGINHNKLNEIVANPQQFFLNETLIATGSAPIMGVDGKVKLLYDLSKGAKRPVEMEDGKVDFKEVTTINNVKKGQIIAERIAATPGIPGIAVTGAPIKAKDGKEARIKVGKNVVLNSEQTSLYATIDGMVAKTDRDKLNVFPVYEVNGDVNYNVGNIDFVGTVVIKGNVLSGFKIKASGDIRIAGSVEGADLEAEGSIEISAGVLGHNKGLIRAGKQFKSAYLQDATVYAEEVIVNLSMHSNVHATKSVTCKGAKGLIVGGIIQAGESVTARTIGNTMSTVTVIEVGVMPELRNELVHLRTQLRSINESLDKTDKALTMLDQLAAVGKLSPDKATLRIKFNHTKKLLTEERTASKERMLEIEKSLEDNEQAKIDVVATIYSGSKIVIGRYTKFVKDTMKQVRFQFNDGDIAAIPLTKL